MFGLFSLVGKTITAPLWLPWRAYKGLWWAFDVTPKTVRKPVAKGDPAKAPAAAVGSGQRTAFEVVDSTPPSRPLPVRSLRAGYAATYLMSAMTGGIVAGIASDGELSTGRAWVIWAWVTGTIAVASLLVVKKVAKREIAKIQMRQRILGAPQAAVKAAVAGVSACCAKARCAANGDSARAAAKWFAGSASVGAKSAWDESCKAANVAREHVKAKAPGWKARLAPYFTGRTSGAKADTSVAG